MRESRENQIKVRAGQVYVSQTGTKVKVQSVSESTGAFYYKHPKFDFVLAAYGGTFLVSYTFVPQTDLERLAVMLKEWPMTAEFALCYLQDTGFYWRGGHIEKGTFKYPKYQWQNMRYYLGLDKKPHYKLIDGEWVKQ